ncbi:molybdopterin-synthase adenylyltransferase MoeB [Geobacter hydrogenophilus]|uniref:Molybdopterin-synthase adenylyltransferase n=1 Tax=Geobacter hydrogenophilus TaxID=40983 RepID=A0A9W6LDX6_9BACT|nr:molybdopterin-synthase adenylyltransferase MoeB [Geobacter hydrogenophilus]MBT0894424.1 molybdopterin-synthase adenylyltransferase MoeB [Geobacter hydrogenophilus]GLI39420.1 adenylyltransferase [Geobacter hydrogenophilus]
MFTEQQIERYSRHIILREVGGKGQKKLLEGKVMVIGAGGLGAPIALYLAAAGVGTIGIADADVVDLSNLQRQVIHFTPDVGKPKVESAREKMEAMNPDVTVRTYQEWISAANIARIIADYDFVIDGTDNFAAKFLINDACVMAGKPYSHGGILQFVGQTMTIRPGESPCYRCIFPAPPPKDAIPTCSQAGVIGVLPGVIGTIQATEAIKFLIGKGELLAGHIMMYNALEMNFRKVKINRNRKCPVCGENPTVTELVDELDALNVCDLEK